MWWHNYGEIDHVYIYISTYLIDAQSFAKVVVGSFGVIPHPHLILPKPISIIWSAQAPEQT